MHAPTPDPDYPTGNIHEDALFFIGQASGHPDPTAYTKQWADEFAAEIGGTSPGFNEWIELVLADMAATIARQNLAIHLTAYPVDPFEVTDHAHQLVDEAITAGVNPVVQVQAWIDGMAEPDGTATEQFLAYAIQLIDETVRLTANRHLPTRIPNPFEVA